MPAQQAITPFANPGEIVDKHYAATVPAPVRLLTLLGHRHAWTTAFTDWVQSSNKEPNVFYQSMDLLDEPTYTYNSEVENPVLAPDKGVDGGYSGVLMLNAGDELHFNCHIEYTDERAMSEHSPVNPGENGPLRFANQAYNAEMCILFSSTVGDIGLLEELGAPPAFAQVAEHPHRSCSAPSAALRLAREFLEARCMELPGAAGTGPPFCKRGGAVNCGPKALKFTCDIHEAC